MMIMYVYFKFYSLSLLHTHIFIVHLWEIYSQIFLES